MHLGIASPAGPWRAGARALAVCAVAACGPGSYECPAVGPAPQSLAPVVGDLPPNILIVVSDDQGVDLVSGYGESSDPPATPVVDSLIADGVRFTQAWASPTCTPSRAALMTGRYPRRTGLGSVIHSPNPTELPLTEITLPRAVPSEYTTAAVGKWHLSSATSPSGLLHPNLSGFDSFAGTISNIGVPAMLGGETELLGYQHWARVEDGAWAWEEGYATTVTVDDALARVAEMPEPWLLYVAFNAPHAPLDPPPGHLDRRGVGKGSPEPELVRASVEAMDAELGRLLDGIEPARDHTVVFFVSDNGTASFAYDPPVAGKNTMTETGLRVPLVVSGPGVAAGATSDALVHLVDVLPTVVELTGGEGAWPVPLDGYSLAPLLVNPGGPSVRQTVYTEKFFPTERNGPWGMDWRALRDRRYKLVRQNSGDALYNMLYEGEDVDLLEGWGTSNEVWAAYQCLSTAMDEHLERMRADHP